MRNRLAKYFLRKWFYFDQNLEYLSLTEEIKMKILYSSLKELSASDRQFLANKYRVAEKPYIKDNYLASKCGMTIKEYKNKRIEIESRLTKSLVKWDNHYHDEFKKALNIKYNN